MANIPITELEDEALNWAVSQYNPIELPYLIHMGKNFISEGEKAYFDGKEKVGIWHKSEHFNPSFNRFQSGEIVEREFISVTIGEWDVEATPVVSSWAARSLHDEIHAASDAGWFYGPTPSIASMRCFVASKHKEDWIDVPDEFIESETIKDRETF